MLHGRKFTLRLLVILFLLLILLFFFAFWILLVILSRIIFLVDLHTGYVGHLESKVALKYILDGVVGFGDEEVEDHEVEELRTELSVQAEVALEGVVQDGLEGERRHHLLEERVRVHHNIALLQ